MDETIHHAHRDREDDLRGLASLGDPVRRSLYRYIVERGVPVGRDEAASAAGLGRSLAAYHLDKLVGEGLLEVSFERLGGRRGPGAGRPAKLYKRAARQFELSLPARDYELAAQLLARAVENDPCGTARRNAIESSRSLGRELAGDVIWTEDGRSGGDAVGDEPGAGFVQALAAALVERGYEPAVEEPGTIRLRNCPFDGLAREHRDLVCNMNLALFCGLADELGGDRLRPTLAPRPGECCVVLAVAASAPVVAPPGERMAE
jgi:predicted ArsR family transcriptional regulator